MFQVTQNYAKSFMDDDDLTQLVENCSNDMDQIKKQISETQQLHANLRIVSLLLKGIDICMCIQIFEN